MANTFRAAIKSSYRFPMMMFFPNFYGNFINDKYQKKLVSGLTIAALGCLIISPLQRLKNHEMTRSHDKGRWGGYRQFIIGQSHGGHTMTELFRGTSAVLVRQMLSWSSFLVLDQFARDMLKK